MPKKKNSKQNSPQQRLRLRWNTDLYLYQRPHIPGSKTLSHGCRNICLVSGQSRGAGRYIFSENPKNGRAGRTTGIKSMYFKNRKYHRAREYVILGESARGTG